MMKYIAFTFILLLLGNGHAQIQLNDGLIAYYPFSGNADDESGNFNHGTGANISLTTDRFGMIDSAFKFNGTNSYISIPSSASLESPTDKLSMIAWINAPGWSLVGSTTFAPIIMKSSSTSNAFQYRMLVSSNSISMAINNWNNGAGIAVPIAFNNWHLLVITMNNGVVKGYHNGLLVGTNTITGSINLDTHALEIGRDVPGATEVFQGKIDDVRIYNRELNKHEIWEIFNPNDIIFADGFE